MTRTRLAAVLTAVTALSLGAGGALLPSAHADPPGEDLLVHYDFSQDGQVSDVSGNGNDGTIHGSGAQVAGGILTLPGGGADSHAGYVQFPEGLFAGQDTLTISTWLRNETGSGNYSALFFGSDQGPFPEQYWLLNPADPSGRFKSVLTGSLNADAPWGTEYGISPTDASHGIPGPVTDGDWAMYTTVITPTSLTGYYNGSRIGAVDLDRAVSDFGTDLVGYIGRSTYADEFYQGAVDEVIVSTAAYTPADVSQLYYGSDRVSTQERREALNTDADAIQIPETTINDLDLPSQGKHHSQIAWASSAPEVIATDGTLTRPGEGSEDASVTLTGTFTLPGESLTREYTVTVPAIDAQRDLERAADRFDLGISVAWADLTLPTTVGDMELDWTSSAPEVIGTDGMLTRPEGETEVTLSATFTRNGHSTQRTYTVSALAQPAGTVAAYVRSGDTPETDVLHLATAATGQEYTGLNANKGVLYPQFGTGTSRFAHPTLFRHPDGTFGLVATNNASDGQIFVYDSPDLVHFSNKRLVQTNDQGITVARAEVDYDNGIGAYRLKLHTPEGKAYGVTTADFTSFSDPVQVEASAPEEVSGLPEGAIESSELALTGAELDTVTTEFAPVVNTSIDAGGDVQVGVGEELSLPQKVDLGYSDGSAKQLGVSWDTSEVDLGTPGTYTVTGTVNQPKYGDEDGILIPERADPWVLRDDQRTGEPEYYFTGSYPTTKENPRVGYDRIVLRRADTINGLTTAEEEVLLWANDAADPDTSNGSSIAEDAFRYFWAPEFHRIGGDWYILFTASRGDSVWDIRPAVMRAPGDSDPMDASNWEFAGYVQAAPGDDVAFTHFSLDMTYFEAGGHHYMVWAEKPGSSNLRIAEVDPDDPTQLTSDSVLLSQPDYAWERTANESINEGAAVITSEDEVFVFFSASEVDETYSIGMLRAPIGGDLLDPDTWTKTGYPLLTSEDFDGQQLGPGHNSFTTDLNGNPVIVYHARPPKEEWPPGADGGLNDPSRHARVKTVHFTADGSLVLNQTRTEELAEQNRTVTLTVTVTGEEDSPVRGSVAPRCVAGDVVLVATAQNDADVPAEVTITSEYGSVAVGEVPPGKARSQAFTTRGVEVPAGAVEIRARFDGGASSSTDEVAYRPFSCR